MLISVKAFGYLVYGRSRFLGYFRVGLAIVAELEYLVDGFGR
jgi:hypothetical protein